MCPMAVDSVQIIFLCSFIKERNRGREQKVKHILLIEVRNGSREQMAQNILLIIRLGEDVEKKVKASKRSFFF